MNIKKDWINMKKKMQNCYTRNIKEENWNYDEWKVYLKWMELNT